MFHQRIALSPDERNLKKKDRLWNISQLLSQNIIQTPQKLINQRLFPSQNSKKTIKTPLTQPKMQKIPRPTTKSNLRMNFQHYRIKSSLKHKNEQFQNKEDFALQRHNSQPIMKNVIEKALIFQPIYNKSLFNEKIALLSAYKSQQLTENREFYSLNHQTRRQDTTKVGQDSRLLLNNNTAKSLQMSKRSSQSLFPSNLQILSNKKHFNNPRNQNPQFHPTTKSFLKKGASLQKQIVINLLKNKMIKQQEFQVEKEYTMSDIVKMVKLYKGGSNITKDQLKTTCWGQRLESSVKQKVDKVVSCPIGVIQQFQKSIEGWEIEPEIELEFIKKQEVNEEIKT